MVKCTDDDASEFSRVARKKRIRAGGRAGRRASLLAADFRASVLEHVVHTCAKELRDASALDFYNAFAHTVRDRLVHRWLATQRTHVEQDVKRVCYFSSEFLTGRSLGPLPDEHGPLRRGRGGGGRLRPRARTGPRVRGRSGPRQRRPRAAGGLLHGLAGDARAAGHRLRHPLRLRHVRAEDRGRAPGRAARQLAAARQRLGAARATRRRRPSASAATSSSIRTGKAAPAPAGSSTRRHRLPYDSFIVGHPDRTANTLRLWSRRDTRFEDLQLFETNFASTVQEKRSTPRRRVGRCFFPNDHTERRLRLEQQLLLHRLLNRRHNATSSGTAQGEKTKTKNIRDRLTAPSRTDTQSQLNDARPSIAVAELMPACLIEWLGRRLADHHRHHRLTNHTLIPSAGALVGGAVRAPLAAASADHLRDQSPLPAPGAAEWPDDDGHWPMSIIDENGTQHVRMATWRRSGPQRQRRGQAHSTWSRAPLCRLHELWPILSTTDQRGDAAPLDAARDPRFAKLLTSHRLGSIDCAGCSPLQALDLVHRRRRLPRGATRARAATSAERPELVAWPPSMTLPAERSS